MALTAQLVRDDRRADREPLDVAGTLRHVPSLPIDVVVEDLSATGFRVRTQIHLNLQERVTIGIPGIGQRTACVVRRTPDGFGCEFVEAIDPRLIRAAQTAQSVVEGDFGGQSAMDQVREWSRANPPHVRHLAHGHRMLIIGGLGVAGWLAVLGLFSLL